MLKKYKYPLKVTTNVGTPASTYNEMVAKILGLVRNDRRLSILEVACFMLVG
jgi:hypothetical protein